MKNLVLYDVKRYGYRIEVDEDERILESDKYVIFVKNRGVFIEISFYLSETNMLISQFTINLPMSIIHDPVFLAFDQKLVLISTNAVYFCSIDGHFITYVFDRDYVAAAISNNETDLALVDVFNNVYVFDLSIGNLMLRATCEANAKPEQTVFVGWGSESTQFQGPRGPNVNEPQPDYVCRNRLPTISWRGNSEMFAVNVFNGRSRLLRVYSNVAVLLHQSTVHGLEHLVSFKPGGSALAVITTQTGNDQSLAVVEPNGEIKSVLRLEGYGKVIEIKWSPCGTAIGISQVNKSCCTVDIFMMRNHFWQKKQSLIFKLFTYKQFNWDKALNSMLLLKTYTNTEVITYTFINKIIKCQKFADDRRVNPIINGNEVVFVSFDKCTGCPPNSCIENFSVRMDKQVAYVSSTFGSRIAVIDVDYNIKVFDFSTFNEWVLVFESPLFIPGRSDMNVPLNIKCIYLAKANQLDMILLNVEEGQRDLYVEMVFKDMIDVTILEKTMKLNGVFYIGEPYNIDPPDDILLKCIEDHPVPAMDLFVVSFNDVLYSVCLTTIGVLTINDQQLRSFVTSMYYDGEYFILTISKENSGLDGGDGENVDPYPEGDYIIAMLSEEIETLNEESDLLSKYFHRSIEKGAIIVNHVKDSAYVILQMPRGNTETVTLKNMAIKTIEKLVNEVKYADAYLYARFNGLGVNLLVDVNPEQFLNHTNRAYTQLEQFEVIVKLFSGLKDDPNKDNKTAKEEGWKYKFPLMENKRERICNALIDHLCGMPVMGTVRAAVRVIAGLFTTFPVYNIPRAMNSVSDIACESLLDAEFAIKSMSTYVSFEDMYRYQISRYNMFLAELVASLSNMDPMIYGEFLNHLKALPAERMRFEANNYIGNTRLAAMYATEIYNIEQTEENKNYAINYALDKSCFDVVYATASDHTDLKQEAALLFGNQLIAQGKSEEAAFLLYRYQYYKEAMEAFVKMNSQEALAALHKADLSLEDKSTFYHKIAESLSSSGKHKEAANIYLNYIDDVEFAIESFLEAKEFKEVLRIAILRDQPNIIVADLIPAVELHASATLERIEELRATFNKSFERLKIVRIATKLEKNNQLANHPDLDLGPIEDDLYSNASTIRSATRSVTSTSSSSSSSNRRKLSKKLTSTREGSKYEDVALMQQLYGLIHEIFNMQGDVKNTLSSIVIIKGPEPVNEFLLHELHKNFNYLRVHVSKAASIVWPAVLTQFDMPQEDRQLYENLALIDIKFRTPPPNMIIEWVLESMEKMTITEC